MSLRAERANVLVVDDEPQILEAVRDVLEGDFTPFVARSAVDALDLLVRMPIAVILSDQRMPNMSGDEFLKRAREVSDATRILITGYSDLQALVNAVNQGQIYAYVPKPWEPEELRILVHRAVEHYQLIHELAHEQRLLHALMDNTPDGIYFKDREHRYVRLNRTGAKMIGIDAPEKAVGRTAADFFGGEVAAEAHAVEDRIARTRTPVLDAIGHVVSPDGKGRWHSSTRSPIIDSAGQVTGLIAVVRDVTERYEAQEAVRRSEARFRDLVAGSIQGICVHREQKPLFLNRAYARLFGYQSPEELLAEVGSIERFVAPHEVERLRANNEARLRGEAAPSAYEFDGVHRDGTPMRLQSLARVVSWDGEPAIQAVVVDLTEARRAQAEIESLARFYGDNPFPVLRVFPDGTISHANAASRVLLSFWETRVGDRVPEEWSERVRAVLANGDLWQTELECDERVLRLNVVPFPEAGYANLYGEDVTVLKRAEERLRQVQKMEAVGQLTGGVAHDFNNRLTVILGNLELLELKAGEDPGLLKLIQSALKAAEGGAKLTRQLLSFARGQVLEPQELDLSAFVSGMKDMIARIIGVSVELRLGLPEELWPVHTDPAQLEDVVVNLVVNARDAMRDGGRLLIETANTTLDEDDVAVHRYVQPGDYVLLAVTDTGCGMPPAVQRRVFEPFFTTKDIGQGTGLGLSMVYGFVKQSQGFIHVYSEVDVGTCIKIYLPRATEAIQHAHVPLEAGAVPLAGSETVLVVEDEAGVREVAVKLLEDLGYRVLTATNGPQAIAVAEREAHIDLLFTDTVMPGGMDGASIARRVQAIQPKLHVLYTSGYTQTGAMDEIRRHGEWHWIAKPYSRSKLAHKIREILSGNDASDQRPIKRTFS